MIEKRRKKTKEHQETDRVREIDKLKKLAKSLSQCKFTQWTSTICKLCIYL